MHKGMDFTAPTGTPIYASGNGIIYRADNKASGF
ncbi:MAG TPA: M23 family peptidase, partial [Thermodesulfobacteriaceae bacterium]|nr:M23 family peptidase [Thermodesulfobacteriaceae bacterium]